MAKNTIQFHKGLGLHEFPEKYVTEEQCKQALYALRWPTGYICPNCGNTTSTLVLPAISKNISAATKQVS